MKITRKSDIFRATDEEIKDFFNNVTFTGDFSELNSEDKIQASKFCGYINNITINGIVNDLCPNFIPVPNRFKPYIEKGLCEFKAFIDLKSLRGEKGRYRLFIIKIKPLKVASVRYDKNAQEKIIKNLKLRDNKFVGKFTENKDGSFTIRDIRRSDFSKLILQNGKEQQPIVFHPRSNHPQDGMYYEFSWILTGEKENYIYLFKVDETDPFIEVRPKDLIQRLYDDIMSYPAGASQKIVKMLDTLKNQLTANGKEIFIYELLQNANDYPYMLNDKKEAVDVEFHLTQTSLIFMHSGSEFNEKNIAAICSINDKEKDTNKDTIGYKGIGFKTVFLDNENVYLQTGNYSFRFDIQATKDMVDTPWQILPIWTKFSELTSAERAVFTLADKKFRVKFALKPAKEETLKDSPHSYEKMFRDVFKNERVILFIPNLLSVKVYLQGTSTPDIICNRSNDTWRVDHFQDNIDEELTRIINDAIDEQESSGGLKIPTKYYDFNKTKVSFACEINGRNLKSVEDTCLYCYLPAKEAKWGLKFLMNTDMIPNGPRDDIETDFANTININEKIAYIAGSKFFDWIYKLCDSQKYNLDSVFNLIPDFTVIKENYSKYEDFIESFKEGFDTRLENDALIPTEVGYTLLRDTILDQTGLTSAKIIADELFLEYTGYEDKNLPVFELRKSESFSTFLEVYLDEFGFEENTFDEDSLRNLIQSNDFIGWLKVQENNNNFLKFLLNNDLLDSFLNEEIFIEEECGQLYSADSIYYDVDIELEDLQSFSKYIPYLSLETRSFFANNSDWEDSIEGYFKSFDAENFINKELLGEAKEKVIEFLNKWDTSFHFYSFLAKNEIIPTDLLELPFFNDEAEIVDDFEDRFVFLSSDKGKEVCSTSWLLPVTFAFISPDYDEQTLLYFQENAEVRKFSDSIIIKEIVLSEEYQSDINTAQQKSEDLSAEFFNYCFKHKTEIQVGDLKNYALSVVDKDGDKSFTLSEDYIYFPSVSFDNYSAKQWIDYDWMYCLDSIYINNTTSQEKQKKDFLHKAFGVDEIDEKSFYCDVVKKNIKDIISTTSGSNDLDGNKNIDFVSYLDDNYSLIFVEKKDGDIFDDFILVGEKDDEIYDIFSDAAHIYTFDNELKDILNSDWFPDDIVSMCSSHYRGTKALLAIKAKKYSLPSFFDDVITEEISNISSNIDTKQKSIAFHQFIIDRRKDLTDNQKEVMKEAPIYLYGDSDASLSSSGHKTLSTRARELFDKGLVDFSDLDIIDSDYKTEDNIDYWETLLGNSKFTIIDFISWLLENTESFVSTIENKELNLSFWRWLKENKISNQALERLPSLPILLKNKEDMNSASNIYLSDEYVEEGGLETLVTKYDPDALFISADYIEEEGEIEEWKSFWKKIGVQFEMIHILVDTIKNRLNEIEDEKLPATIVEYRNELKEEFKNLPTALADLRVKAFDGQFYSIADIIYVNCGDDEPFKYVEMPNQASFDTFEERSLITEIILSIDGNKIDNNTEWVRAKINRYIEIQDSEEDSFISIHFKFIDELAEMYDKDKSAFKEYDELKHIKILDSKNKLCCATDLTMGSIYSPYCDFEKFKLNYNYLSESYKNKCNNDIRNILSRVLRVHCFFTKNDIDSLNNRDFSIYFWSDYLTTKGVNHDIIFDYIKEGIFDNIACIPTKDYMKRPCEVYNPSIYSYVKYIQDKDNKQPLESIPDIRFKKDGDSIFSLLKFKEQLDFYDSLCALIHIKGQDKRTQILQWMIDSYDEKYDSCINEYRNSEDARWKNNGNKDIQIKELYALATDEKMLEEYFGNLPQIINKLYLPKGESFREACDILKIPTIEASELIIEPVGKENHNSKIKNTLLLYVLALAGHEDAEDWMQRYKQYKIKIDNINFWCCTAISLHYSKDPSICQEMKKFHHEEGSTEFFFVKSLEEKSVFISYINSLINYLGIEAEKDIVIDVMDSRESAKKHVKENNTLMLDNLFKDEMEKIVPGISADLIGQVAIDEDLQEGDGRTIKTINPSIFKEHTNEDRDANLTDKEEKESIFKGESTEKDLSESNSAIETSFTSVDEYDDSVIKGDSSEQNYSNNRSYSFKEPKPIPFEEIQKNKSQGVSRTLEVAAPTALEVEELNSILGKDMTPEQIADQNYLVQLRLYNDLKDRNMDPVERKEDFIRKTDFKYEHYIAGGKYIHKCSAAGGIMYLSPAIWNKITDNNCVVCVYLGPKANEFRFINSIDEILKWIGEDDIIIKLTGKEKVEVVEELYSGILKGVKGTAYTLISLNSNERYDSIFKAFTPNNIFSEPENDDEY